MTVSLEPSSHTPMRSIKGENVIYGDIDLHNFILIAEFYSMRLYVCLCISITLD